MRDNANSKNVLKSSAEAEDSVIKAPKKLKLKLMKKDDIGSKRKLILE